MLAAWPAAAQTAPANPAAASPPAPAPGAAATSAAPGATPPSALSTQNQRLDAILDGMSASEKRLYDRMQEMTPRVETYMQNLRTDPTLGEVPVADRYYLGILHFHGGHFQTISFLPEPRQYWRQLIGPIDDLLTRPARRLVGLDLFRSSFASMLFPGKDHFDRQHYRFAFVGTAFLGEVRCYVFDVVPRDVHAKGSFWGRIWIEDHNLNLVRFNGSFWQNRFEHPDLHFDSWRVNVKPDLWVPAYIYSEESDLAYGLFRHVRYKSQTRLWGYFLKRPGQEEELTTMDIEGAGLAPTAPPKQILSPLASTRAWERQAEDNVLSRLQQAGILAPPGPADKVLETVVNNLIITNHLDISPPVRCRILLTTPLGSLTIGHTIVLSRGLIDSLPDEAALAAMLAHGLAQIDLGQSLDTRYAFADRMLFADQAIYRLFHLRRTRAEEDAANTLAVKLLARSPYKDKLASAGLFLRQLAERRKLTPHLLSPQLGNPWFSHGYLMRLRALESKAPPLRPADVSQRAALPLGARLLVDPWNATVSLQPPQNSRLLSAREKMPLQVTPFYPYLERVQPSGAKVAKTASDAGAADPPAAKP